MNGLSAKVARCVPMQLSSATLQNSATATATAKGETARKPASIQELRAQLRAQHDRNQHATENGQVAPQVAHGPTSKNESCVEKGWGFETRNCATEVWGPFTPWTSPVSIELVCELRALIALYAERFRLSEYETARIIQAAKHQAASTLHESVAYFRKQIKAKS
ncbi:hypothetical protein BH11PSE11_BH11PSE11_12290 [soil metagenome]